FVQVGNVEWAETSYQIDPTSHPASHVTSSPVGASSCLRFIRLREDRKQELAPTEKQKSNVGIILITT
ncbi:MAG: hypothetical protein PHS17_05355, partial [Desulfobacterales bacterium]|nr:hypothetical protein [Desulfobacterales bacterium]